MRTAVGRKNVGGRTGRARLMFCAMAAVSSALVLSGCATIVSGSRQKVEFTSPQENVKVEVFDVNKSNNIVFQSNAPAKANLKRGSGFFSGADYRLEVSREGLETQILQISSELNTAPYLNNIWLGGWLGMLIIDPATGAMWKLSAPDRIDADLNAGTVTGYNRSDGYFSVKYVLPVSGIPGVNFNLEYGAIWKNGFFWGVTLTEGYSDDSWIVGGGFDFGGVYDLPYENLQLAYGSALGFWLLSHRIEKKYDYYSYYSDDYYDYEVGAHLLAPFVKLRWNFIEMSYRLLLLNTPGIQGDIEKNFTHKIAFGVYLEGKKRHGYSMK